MKSLKITLALVGVLLLTVSGVKSEEVNVVDESSVKQSSPNIDLLAHRKGKLKLVKQG